MVSNKTESQKPTNVTVVLILVLVEDGLGRDVFDTLAGGVEAS